MKPIHITKLNISIPHREQHLISFFHIHHSSLFLTCAFINNLFSALPYILYFLAQVNVQTLVQVLSRAYLVQ